MFNISPIPWQIVRIAIFNPEAVAALAASMVTNSCVVGWADGQVCDAVLNTCAFTGFIVLFWHFVLGLFLGFPLFSDLSPVVGFCTSTASSSCNAIFADAGATNAELGLVIFAAAIAVLMVLESAWEELWMKVMVGGGGGRDDAAVP